MINGTKTLEENFNSRKVTQTEQHVENILDM
jgi:hypothetical protein